MNLKDTMVTLAAAKYLKVDELILAIFACFIFFPVILVGGAIGIVQYWFRTEPPLLPFAQRTPQAQELNLVYRQAIGELPKRSTVPPKLKNIHGAYNVTQIIT